MFAWFHSHLYLSRDETSIVILGRRLCTCSQAKNTSGRCGDLPHFYQVLDAGTKAMVEVVLPHDARHAWVGQDVSIACLLSAARWEGPVLLSAACTHPPQHSQRYPITAHPVPSASWADAAVFSKTLTGFACLHQLDVQDVKSRQQRRGDVLTLYCFWYSKRFERPCQFRPQRHAYKASGNQHSLEMLAQTSRFCERDSVT